MTPFVSVANPIQAVSDRFSNLVRDRVTLAQLADINRLNRELGPGTCATFRFLDSDVLMSEAFALATGYFYSSDREADQSLWNAAWALSKAAGFTRRMQLNLLSDGDARFAYVIHDVPVSELRRDKTGQFEIQPNGYYQLTDEEIAAAEHANAFLHEDRERKLLNVEPNLRDRTEWSPIETVLYNALKRCLFHGPDEAETSTKAALAAYESQLDAATRVNALRARDRSASALLVDAVNATGGLICGGPGVFFPKADSQWLDLSDAYLAACCERRVEPLISLETAIEAPVEELQQPPAPTPKLARLADAVASNTPKFPEVHVRLTGADGNVFAIMHRVEDALRNSGATKDQIKVFCNEMEAGDYDDALRTVMRWVRVS